MKSLTHLVETLPGNEEPHPRRMPPVWQLLAILLIVAFPLALPLVLQRRLALAPAPPAPCSRNLLSQIISSQPRCQS